MPHIRMRGLKIEQVQTLSLELAAPLAEAMETDIDNFTFESVQTLFFSQGQENPGYPFVEVLWFARSQEVQDTCAKIITGKIQSLQAYEYVTVVFQVLNKNSYYENGKHF
ncbi:hypothetical protein D3C87_242010 [compost metagenome]